MGAALRKFLVIDDHGDNRFLLTRTLKRKYPESTIHETSTLAPSLAYLQAGGVDAVIGHRAGEITGIELVRELRRVDPLVPIVMVSGIDRSRAAFAAGATRFLNYDEWLRVGLVIEDIFATQPWAAMMGVLAYAIRTRTTVTFELRDAASPLRLEAEPYLVGETSDGRLALRARCLARHTHERPTWQTYRLDQLHRVEPGDHSFLPHTGAERDDGQILRVMHQV